MIEKNVLNRIAAEVSADVRAAQQLKPAPYTFQTMAMELTQ